MATVQIGSDKEALEKQAEIVLQIVNSPAADKVKVAAIRSLERAMKVEGVSISGTNIDGSTHHHYPERPADEPGPADDVSIHFGADTT